jgi:redox-sensitive bicupin YhaK (pirin superfamily)
VRCSIEASDHFGDVITIRRGGDRMQTRIGWLDSRHTFSFEEHIDPRQMGYRALRALNEDRIAPGHGYGTHARRDVEIVTYVLAGTLRHQDSLGTEAIVGPCGLARMSAGTGILCSQFNASEVDPLHVLQCWLTPDRVRLRPSYQQRAFPHASRRAPLTLIASLSGRDGSVTMRQDIDIFACALQPAESARFSLRPGRHAWVQVVRGVVELNRIALNAGDGASMTDASTLELRSSSVSESLLFDLV